MDNMDSGIPQDGEAGKQEDSLGVSPKKGRRVSALTTIAAGCFAAFILCFVLELFVVGYTLLVITPLLAVAALILTYFRSDRFHGGWIAVLLLIVSGYLIFSITYYEVPRVKRGTGPFLSGTNLKRLGNAFIVFAYDHDETFPGPDWCDRLVEKAYVHPKSFRFYKTDSEEGESDYCLNVHAAGKEMSELPGDMVLLFECRFTPGPGQERRPIKHRKGFARLRVMPEFFSGEEPVYLDRWNQVGGPELVAYDRHGAGCNVLFADGYSRFVKLSELPALRWDVDGKVAFTPPPAEPEREKPFSLTFNHFVALSAGLGIAVVTMTLFTIVRYGSLRYWGLVLLIGTQAAVTGGLFGKMSEAAYLSNKTVGMNAGGVIGFLAGIVFTVMMTANLDRLRAINSPIKFLTAAGMAMGIVCSTLVHLALMIANRETNYFGIIIGIPFGAAAGAIMGCVSGGLLSIVYLRNGRGAVNAE